MAPATPAVQAFVAHARAAHPAALGELNVTVHPSEEAAVGAILGRDGYGGGGGGERAWGAVVFHELSPAALNFSIRLNYSTLPNTNWVTNWIARGLDTRYTRYHLSGFLTLQQLVDEYAWQLAANASANMTIAPRPPTAALAGLPFPTAAYEQNVFYQASGYGCSNARRRTRKCLRKGRPAADHHPLPFFRRAAGCSGW